MNMNFHPVLKGLTHLQAAYWNGAPLCIVSSCSDSVISEAIRIGGTLLVIANGKKYFYSSKCQLKQVKKGSAQMMLRPFIQYHINVYLTGNNKTRCFFPLPFLGEYWLSLGIEQSGQARENIQIITVIGLICLICHQLNGFHCRPLSRPFKGRIVL